MSVKIGDTIPEWVMDPVSPERMRTMAAILRDPNPVHWDRRVVDEMGLGPKTINQGPLGLSYMINMLHEWAGPGSVKRVFMTFPHTVREGDRVVAQGRVTGLRDENGTWLADCEIWLEREGTGRLLDGTAVVSLPKGMHP